jgi:hypothetical protein
VIATDLACPFCGTATFVRALAFAGLLAAPACWSNASTTSQPSSPPTPHEAPAASTGKIEGYARTGDGQPKAGEVITLEQPSGEAITATTDANGYYVFADLAPGTYRLSHADMGNRRRQVGGIELEVGAGDVRKQDFSVLSDQQRLDRSRLKMPYGAPPRRSRVV